MRDNTLIRRINFIKLSRQHKMTENNRIEYKRELTDNLEKEVVAS